MSRVVHDETVTVFGGFRTVTQALLTCITVPITNARHLEPGPPRSLIQAPHPANILSNMRRPARRACAHSPARPQDFPGTIFAPISGAGSTTAVPPYAGVAVANQPRTATPRPSLAFSARKASL